MSLRKMLLAGAASLGLALALSGNASAITIASWGQSGLGNPFVYSENGSNPPGVFDATFAAGTAASPIPVTFDFVNGTGGVLAGAPFAATLQLAGKAESIAVMFGSTGIQDVSIPTMIFRYAGPPIFGAMPGDIIFAMTAGAPVGGTLLGSGSSASIVGSEPANFITYSSSVDPGLALALNKSYSVSLTALTPSPLALAADLNDFKSFSAGTSGVFGAEQVVPEPGTIALFFAVGVSGSLVALRRRIKA